MTQDKHNTMPGYCQGCAWAKPLGGCAVFISPERVWLKEGQCEAYATDKERDAIEHSIDRYRYIRY